MPSISRILQLAPTACYLAANDVNKKALFGRGSLVPDQASKIYNVYKILKHVYDKDHNYTGLTERCNYLYELFKRWALPAAAIVDGGGGGSVSPVIPITGNIYPFIITGANFAGDGVTYNNPDIVGDNLILFVSQYNSDWQIAPDFFTYSSGGFVIVAPGFDANNFPFIIVQKLNAG